MSWFNEYNVRPFFSNDFESSETDSGAAHLFLCSLLSSWLWCTMIYCHSSDNATHVSLIGTAYPLGVDRTDVLVSAANSLTLIKRNLFCILTHPQGAKVQLLFGHCEWKQVVCCFLPSGLNMQMFHRMRFFTDVGWWMMNHSLSLPFLCWISTAQAPQDLVWELATYIHTENSFFFFCPLFC